MSKVTAATKIPQEVQDWFVKEGEKLDRSPSYLYCQVLTDYVKSKKTKK